MNASQLMGLGVKTATAIEVAQLLPIAFQKGELKTPHQRAAFVATCLHESQQFSQLVENLNYSAEALLSKFHRWFDTTTANQYGRTAEHPADKRMIAILAYGKRKGQRTPEDGWLFRGRGWIQMTLYPQYLEAEQDLGHPYVSNPDLVATHLHGMLTSVNYWNRRNLKDKADILAVSRIVNVGKEHTSVMPHGWAERQEYYKKCLAIYRKADDEGFRVG